MDVGLSRNKHCGFSEYMCTSQVILMVCVTRVAKTALEKALAENENIDELSSSELPLSNDVLGELQQPLIVKTDSSLDIHQR
ncbi:mRNA export factor rsm1 [Bienertia sinuspersici]